MTNPKRGRPSDYSFQVAISICARLAEGKSLRAICSEAGMPGRATVSRWIARHKEFRDEYTLACELRAEDLADEMIEIVDDSSFGWKKSGRMGGRLGSWKSIWNGMIQLILGVHLSQPPIRRVEGGPL
jgi:hypothetical protein